LREGREGRKKCWKRKNSLLLQNKDITSGNSERGPLEATGKETHRVSKETHRVSKETSRGNWEKGR
jgi:hypothetical protein